MSLCARPPTHELAHLACGYSTVSVLVRCELHAGHSRDSHVCRLTVLASLIPSPLPPPVFDRFQELQGRGRPRRSRHVQCYHVASGRQELDSA